jgi:hypothetical protein
MTSNGDDRLQIMALEIFIRLEHIYVYKEGGGCQLNCQEIAL